MVFVRNQRGEPLMPITPQKAKKLLKQKKARVTGFDPFVIQHKGRGLCAEYRRQLYPDINKI